MGLKLWLKQHGTAERPLARDLAAFFTDQANRAASAVAALDNPTPHDIGHVFSVPDERAALLKVVLPHLAQSASVGMTTMVDSVDGAKALRLLRKKEIHIDGQREFGFAADLPDEWVKKIQAYLDELEKQSYWADIQTASQGHIEDILRDGLQDGMSGYQMAKAIREDLGGDTAKVRAKAIARSETTGAMNAGHYMGLQELAKDGKAIGKTWLAIEDKDTRETHSDVDGTTIPVADDFQVGDDTAPYPGYYGLSAEERVNCRCVLISDAGVAESQGSDDGQADAGGSDDDGSDE